MMSGIYFKVIWEVEKQIGIKLKRDWPWVGNCWSWRMGPGAHDHKPAGNILYTRGNCPQLPTRGTAGLISIYSFTEYYQIALQCAWTKWHSPQSHQNLRINIFINLIFKKNLFIYYLFLAVLGLHCCTPAFSSCGERGLLFVAVCSFSLLWLLLLRSMGSRRLGFSSCGTRAQ